MALAAEEFAELIQSMGLAGTAAANYENILARLTAATNAAAAAEKIAAASGTTAAQVRSTLAAANKEAAAAEARLAAEQERAAAAAEKAAERSAREAAAKEAAAERAAAAAERAAEREAASSERAAAAAERAAERAARVAEKQAAAAEKAAAEAAKQAQPIDEVAAAMQKLQKQAHETKVLEEAKRRLGMIEPPAKVSTQAMNALGQSASNAVDRLTPTSGVLGTISEVLSAMGPKGRAIALVLAAIVTVATAAAAAIWALVTATVRLSQEKDALAETFGALGDGTKTAKELWDQIGAIGDALPFIGSKTEAWAKSMLSIGKNGPALEQSILALASATALMGEEGGRAAENLIKRFALMADTGQKVSLDRRLLSGLAEAGVSAKALAAELGVAPEKLGKMKLDAAELGEAFERAIIAKGAGSLQRMSLTWTSISAKIGDAWEDLFEDMGSAVDPLMTAVRDLFSEFFTGATLQKGTKSILVDVLSTILGWATRAIRAIHVGFLELQIGALKAYIMFAPLIAVIKMVLTNAEFLRGIKTILIIIAAAIGVVIAGMGLMGAAMATMTGFAVTAFGAVQGAIMWVIGVITGFVQAMITGGTEGGSGFITGLIEGIRAGATAVANAVSDVAKNAEAAFTGFFEIRSPSRKMKRHGRQLPAGAAEGADEGAIQLEKSIDDIWQMPRERRSGRSGAMERGPGRSITFTNCYFWDTDESKIRALWQKFLDQEEAAGPEPEPA